MRRCGSINGGDRFVSHEWIEFLTIDSFSSSKWKEFKVSLIELVLEVDELHSNKGFMSSRTEESVHFRVVEIC